MSRAGRRSNFLLLGAGAMGAALLGPAAAAKTPGATYCFRKVCHRVLTLAETAAEVGKPRLVEASHYDVPGRDRFNPSVVTSSGEHFRASDADNAASPILPDGTKVAVYSPVTRQGAIIRINNAGPYHGGRTLDVSRGLAEKLGFARHGVARLTMEVLEAPTPKEARFARGRRYGPVPGFVGPVADMGALRDAYRVCAGSDEQWPQCKDPRKWAGAQAVPRATANLVAGIGATLQGLVCALLPPQRAARPGTAGAAAQAGDLCHRPAPQRAALPRPTGKRRR